HQSLDHRSSREYGVDPKCCYVSDLHIYIQNCIDQIRKKLPVKILFSKPRQKNGFLKARIESILIDESLAIKLIKNTKTQAFTEMIPAENVEDTIQNLLT